MNHTADAKQFCHHLWHQYLEERSYEIPGGYFSPQISVIGTGKHEVSHSLQEFAVLLEREEKQWNGTFVIEQEAYQARQLSDNVYMVYGELDVNEDARDRINYELHFRFTIILQYTPSGWELLHVHQSVPDINQCSDEFFPKRLIEQSNEQLREKIAQKTRELQESNKAVLYYSHHDYLTKLTNRYYCEKQIEEQLRNGKQGTILMMDVDHFKFYNDTYGHPVGDRILIMLAQALQKTFSKDIVSRIGGDEFLVYCPRHLDNCMLEHILAQFREHWEDEQRQFPFTQHITLSIGVTYFPEHGSTYQELFQKVDTSMYNSKKGMHSYRIYADEEQMKSHLLNRDVFSYLPETQAADRYDNNGKMESSIYYRQKNALPL